VADVRRFLLLIALIVLALGGLGVAAAGTGTALRGGSVNQAQAGGFRPGEASPAHPGEPVGLPKVPGRCRMGWTRFAEVLPGAGSMPGPDRQQVRREPEPWPAVLWTVASSLSPAPPGGSGTPVRAAVGAGLLDPLARSCVLRI
jgi:hypothetical protein